MAKKANLHLFPSLVCIIAPVTFLITLTIAVWCGHVYRFLPYISDTGDKMPESCIFSQFLNLTALLLLICVYIRYLQVKSLATFKTPIGHRLSANDISWYTGFISCLGMDIVANFQVHNIKYVHYAGAGLCFIGGSFYFVFQTIFSYHLSKVDDSKYLFYIRCALCSVSVALCSSAIYYGVASSFAYDGQSDDSSWWTTDEGGYLSHVLSTGSEWLLAITQSMLVLSFLPEFKRISIYSPRFEISGVNDNTPEAETP